MSPIYSLPLRLVYTNRGPVSDTQRIRLGALDGGGGGGPQCRLSILRNGIVPCHCFRTVPVDFKIVQCRLSNLRNGNVPCHYLLNFPVDFKSYVACRISKKTMSPCRIEGSGAPGWSNTAPPPPLGKYNAGGSGETAIIYAPSTIGCWCPGWWPFIGTKRPPVTSPSPTPSNLSWDIELTMAHAHAAPRCPDA